MPLCCVKWSKMMPPGLRLAGSAGRSREWRSVWGNGWFRVSTCPVCAVFEVRACTGVAAVTGDGDAVERGVGLAVSLAVQPLALGLCGGLLDGADTAQSGE